MRILLSSNHVYPAAGSSGSGTNPKEFPSGSAFIVHDLVAKGLAEAGHEVFYLLPRGAENATAARGHLVARTEIRCGRGTHHDRAGL